MFVCLFWAAVLGADVSGRRDRAKAILMLFMLVTAVLYFGHLAFFMHVGWLLPWTDTLYVGCNLAVYPLYLIYIMELTDNSARRFRYVSWLLPAVAGMLAAGVLYGMMTTADVATFVGKYLYRNHTLTLSHLPYAQAVVHDVCKVVFALEIVPVLYLGSRQIRQFDLRVLSNYADTDDKVLNRMHTLLMFFVLTSAVSFASNIVGRHHFDHTPWLLALPSLTFSSLLFVLGYVGHMQKFSIADMEEDLRLEALPHAPLPAPRVSSSAGVAQPTASRDDATAVPPEADAGVQDAVAHADAEAEDIDLRQRLDRVMMRQQLYLHSNLKLADLVRALHTNRNYIYNIINREMGMSFSEYVNRLRVQHAARLLDEGRDLSHAELAERSGFSSITSFYRNFKLYAGCSPKEYQNKQKQQQ